MAALLALTMNCHSDPKKTSPRRADDFNPFVRAPQAIEGDISVLKGLFIDGQVPLEAKP